MEKHVDALLEVLLLKVAAIRPIATRFYGSIHCVVQYYEDYATPGIQLSQKTVHSLAELGLAVTFGLYFYSARGRANWTDHLHPSSARS